jgi:hypothetical protein
MNKMFVIKNIVGFLTFSILLLSSPVLASTATVVEDSERIVLLQQIKKLLVELGRLQALVEKQNQGLDSNGDYAPYSTVLFTQPVETIYQVENGQLLSIVKSNQVRLVDKQLFDLFVSVVGRDVVVNNVKEWRVFFDNKSDLGAFVETVSGSGAWVVGINRFCFSNNEQQVKNSFANLFVHEYSHILLFEETTFNESFKNKFWTKLDFSNQLRARDALPSERFNISRFYYDTNKDRFVSDYATLSPEEDVAETFVSFINENKPLGFTLAERKILSFYEDEKFVKIREQLRLNLKTLKVL